MKPYWTYLKWVLDHKRLVFVEGWKLGTPFGGPLKWVRWFLQLLIHDYSKFSRHEFPAYARNFYGKKATKRAGDYDRAWLHHVHRNPHHWDYWVLRVSSDVTALKVPERYLREMAADWLAIARKKNKPPTQWYGKHRDTVHLHPESRARIETLIGYTAPVPPVTSVATVRTTPSL